MYKTRRRAAFIAINIVAAIIFIVVAISLAPQTKINDYRIYSNFFPIAVTSVLFVMLVFASVSIYNSYKAAERQRISRSSSTNCASATRSKTSTA